MKTRDIRIITWVIFIALIFPFLLAVWMGKGEYVFNGFLLNPMDGMTYLAKMYQGWAGNWQFTLPFTAEAGSGSFIFLFYIFLGHLARWLGLPLLIVFHAARLMAAGLLLYSLNLFLRKFYYLRPNLIGIAFLLSAAGSGMGWLLIFGGIIPFDFWVAEAFPFLSMFTNPHFPLSLAIFLFIPLILLETSSWQRCFKLIASGLFMAIINPFGLVNSLVLAAGWFIWEWVETRRLHWQPLLCLGSLGGPFLLYQLLTILTHPVLSGWNAQNITLTPSVWDVGLSLCPAFLLALYGWVKLIREKCNPMRPFLLLWPVIGLGLAYLPVTLQRRFSFGLFIPLAALAVYAVDDLCVKWPHLRKILLYPLLIFSMITNVLLLFSAILSVGNHPPLLYLSRDEVQALAWIREETPEKAVFLASPEMSLMIPAYSGRRVVYAHPFETYPAEKQLQKVKSFYQQPEWTEDKKYLMLEDRVDYVVFGLREQKLGSGLDLSQLSLIYEGGSVKIFSVREIP